jgi:hypothetical protein
MRFFFTMLCLIFSGLLLHAQTPYEYKVKHKIPVHRRPNGEVIANAAKNRVLMVYAYDRHYDCFKVKYKDFYGVISPQAWINDAFWQEAGGKISEKKNPDSTIVENARQFLVEKINKLSNTSELEMDQKRIELIHKYGYTDGMNISNSKVWIGMTVDMAIDSWGIPYRVKRNKTNWGIQEQWIYSNAYLYFDNGILAEIFLIKK